MTFHIHFVCTGNIYRSRLAEAYLNSKQVSHLIVSSSGTQATTQYKGPITWYALRLLTRNKLIPFMKSNWTQTTAKQFNNVDIVIFIGKENYLYCQKQQYLGAIPFEIWDLPDFDDTSLNLKSLDENTEINLIKQSEELFKQVEQKVDNLLTKLKQ